MAGDTNRPRMTVVQLNVLVTIAAVGAWLLVHYAGNTTLKLIFLVWVLLLAGGLIAVVSGTIRKTKWGMNLERVVCPRCGAAAPLIRNPKTVKQALWGGWTCKECGAEIDKWGRELTPPLVVEQSLRIDGPPHQGPQKQHQVD